jgi:hypothetical protein
MPKKRFPDPLVFQICQLIRAAAYTLRDEKKRKGEDTGIKNPEIVERIKHDVHALFSRHYLSLTEHYLSTQVSTVLEGRGAERSISSPIIPGLNIAEWLAIPPDDHKGPDHWKLPRDCSPNDLERNEKTRRARIQKETAELEKIRILRTTALERGCDPDEPISTVFDDDHPPPLGPVDHPSP